MVGVLLSRVLGLVRDATIYSRFAPGDPQLDAYVAAFRIPDFIYAVVIGGALATTLIPVFQQVWHEEGEARAWELASAVFNIVLVILVLVLAVVAVFRALVDRNPVSCRAAPAASADYDADALVSAFAVAAWYRRHRMALLNARERFSVPAFAFNIYNLMIIFGALVLSPWWGIEGVAFGVVLGAAMYVLVQIPALVKAGMRYVPVFNLRDPAVRRVGRQIVPRLVGQSAVQINFIATTSFAALLAGNQIAALNGAYQLMLLPHGVFVMSLVTVLFPQMSQLWARGETTNVSGYGGAGGSSGDLRHDAYRDGAGGVARAGNPADLRAWQLRCAFDGAGRRALAALPDLDCGLLGIRTGDSCLLRHAGHTHASVYRAPDGRAEYRAGLRGRHLDDLERGRAGPGVQCGEQRRSPGVVWLLFPRLQVRKRRSCDRSLVSPPVPL